MADMECLVRYHPVLKQPPSLVVFTWPKERASTLVSHHVIVAKGPIQIQYYQLLTGSISILFTWKPWVVGRADNCICGNSQNHSLKFSERVAACSICRDLMLYLKRKIQGNSRLPMQKASRFQNTKIHYITVSGFRATSIRYAHSISGGKFEMGNHEKV